VGGKLTLQKNVDRDLKEGKRSGKRFWKNEFGKRPKEKHGVEKGENELRGPHTGFKRGKKGGGGGGGVGGGGVGGGGGKRTIRKTTGGQSIKEVETWVKKKRFAPNRDETKIDGNEGGRKSRDKNIVHGGQYAFQ